MRAATRLIPFLLSVPRHVKSRALHGMHGSISVHGFTASRTPSTHTLGNMHMRPQASFPGRLWFTAGCRFFHSGTIVGSNQQGMGVGRSDDEGGKWGLGGGKAWRPAKRDLSSRKKLQIFFHEMRWKRKMRKKEEKRAREVDGDQAPQTENFWGDEKDQERHPSGIDDALTCPIINLFGLEEPEYVLPMVQEDIETVLSRIEIPREKQLNLRQLVDSINEEAKDLFGPAARLMPFGSLAAGLGTKYSDLDVQVTLGREWEDTIERVRQKDLAKKMQEAKQKTREVWGEDVHKNPLWQGQDSKINVENVDMSWREEDNKDVVENKQNILKGLAKRLRRIGLAVRPILKARVPIIRILPDEGSGFLSMDISVARSGNSAVHTARYLKNYTKLDLRFKHLVMLVKTWAKRRGINDSFEGTLSSYTISLMDVKPQIVPSLFQKELLHPAKVAAREKAEHKRAMYFRSKKARNKPLRPHEELDPLDMKKTLDEIEDDAGVIKLPHEPIATVTGQNGHLCEIRYHTDLDALQGWGDKNGETTAHLLVRFFAYYSMSFEWEQTCISVRKGWAEPLKDSGLKMPKPRPVTGMGCCMFVEDPFDPSNNVAKYVDDEGLEKIQEEFKRAIRLIQEPGGCRKVFQSLQAQKLLSSEEEEENERLAERRRTILARIRGLQAAHQIIYNLGGHPDPITWEDVEQDIDLIDLSEFGLRRHNTKIEQDDSEI